MNIEHVPQLAPVLTYVEGLTYSEVVQLVGEIVAYYLAHRQAQEIIMEIEK